MNFKKTALVAATMLSFALPAHARELKISTAAPEASLYGVRLSDIAESLDRLSGGTLTLKPYYSSTLGDEQTVIRQTVKGRIDIGSLSASAVSLAAPEVAITMEPYLFESNDHMICVMNKYAKEVFAESLEKAGLVALGYFDVGLGGSFANVDLNTPDDVKGTKLRATPTPPVQNYIESLGASVVTAGVTDMVPMLKTGAIDGADTAVIFGVAIGLTKLVENMTMNGAFVYSGVDVMSVKTWETLSEQEQEWLVAAIDESKDAYHESLINTENALIEKAKADTSVVILTDEQTAPFKAIAETNREEAIARYGEQGAAIFANLKKGIEACAVMN